MDNNGEYLCDFCRRDEGLDIYLTRYIISTAKSHNTDGNVIDLGLKEHEIDEISLQNISGLKSSVNSEIQFRKKN